MDRRRFFTQLAIAASALTLDPERLLWTPSKKLFTAPLNGWIPRHRDFSGTTDRIEYADGFRPSGTACTMSAWYTVLTSGEIKALVNGCDPDLIRPYARII